MHEKCGSMNLRQMLRAKLVGPARRMQRIRQQEQSVCKLLLGEKHARLPSAIALPTDKHLSRDKLPHRPDCVLQPLAITSSISGPWWAIMPGLPKRQITAQHDKNRASKGFRERHEQPRLRIPAGSVGQN